jgi:hypothetical protein
VGVVAPDVVVRIESPTELVVVAVKEAGAGLIVVAMPLIVVRMGVTVDGFPLASTVTQGFKSDSVICLTTAGLADTALLYTRAAAAIKPLFKPDACIPSVSATDREASI